MLLRLIASAGLVAFAYYVGKQVGRMEPIREELERVRNAQLAESGTAEYDDGIVAEQRRDD